MGILSQKAIYRFVGDDIGADLTAEELLTEVSRQYEVYHLMIEEGSGMRGVGGDAVIRKWTNLLGQRAVSVSDCTKIPEIIVSVLEVAAGRDAEEVIDSWDGSTSVTVRKAVSGLTNVDDTKELIEF